MLTWVLRKHIPERNNSVCVAITVFPTTNLFVFFYTGLLFLPPPPECLHNDVRQAEVCRTCRTYNLLHKVKNTAPHTSSLTKNVQRQIFIRHIARLHAFRQGVPICGILLDDFVDGNPSGVT